MPRPLRALVATCWLASWTVASAGDAAPGDFERGRKALSAGDLHRAEAAFAAAAGPAPRDAEALYYLGVTHQRQGRYDDAARVFEEALAADPDLVDIWAPLGISLYRSGDPAAAEAALDEALGRTPDDSLAHLFLGLVRQEAERCDAALPHLEHAADDPAVADAAASPLALCYRRLGR